LKVKTFGQICCREQNEFIFILEDRRPLLEYSCRDTNFGNLRTLIVDTRIFGEAISPRVFFFNLVKVCTVDGQIKLGQK
jgi:hypothetical protein